MIFRIIIAFAFGGIMTWAVNRFILGRSTGPVVLFTGRKSGSDVIADIDAVLTETVQVFLLGRYHDIAPLSAGAFFSAMQALDALRILGSEKKVKSVDEVEAAYVKYFAIVAPSVGIKEVKAMSQQQVGALLQHTQDAIMGKAQVAAAEKKRSERQAIQTDLKS